MEEKPCALLILLEALEFGAEGVTYVCWGGEAPPASQREKSSMRDRSRVLVSQSIVEISPYDNGHCAVWQGCKLSEEGDPLGHTGGAVHVDHPEWGTPDLGDEESLTLHNAVCC